MKVIRDKIARRVALARARYHFELKRQDLQTADVEERLRPELRGRFTEPEYYSQLFRTWLNEAPRLMRVYKRRYVAACADDLRAGRIELFDRELNTSQGIDWHREPLFGVAWPRKYVGALSGSRRGSDVVLLWHLNKMLFLLDTSYAYRVTGDRGFARRWVDWVESWIEQNPYMLGMNWRSPLEIGTRLVVWSIGLQEIGFTYALSETSTRRIFHSLIRQAEYVAGHFSYRDPSNNHLVGEAATLYAFATWWPFLEESSEWKRKSEEILKDEIKQQLLPDGIHFENAFNYHAYVLDFYLLYLYAKCLEGKSPDAACLDGARRLAENLLAFRSPSGRIPRFGDDSLPEFLLLKPLREIESRRFTGSHTMTEIVKPDFAEVLAGTDWGRGLMQIETPVVCRSHRRDSGFSVLRGESSHLVYASGPEHKRRYSPGHLHSDAGSFELEIAGVPVFIDSGTYLYAYNDADRTYFKGARAHNTLVIDDRDPMTSLETFKWTRTVRGRTTWFSGNGDCGAVGSLRVLPSDRDEFHHERVIVQIGESVWIIVDRLSAPHREPDGALHHASVFFHTPLTQDRFELRGGTRTGLRLRAGRDATGDSDTAAGCLEIKGFSSAGYERLLIGDASDRRSWYSPAYGELKYGTTIKVGVDFREALMLVHSIASEDVRVTCHPGEKDRAMVEIETAGESQHLNVCFAPTRIELNQRLLEEDR